MYCGIVVLIWIIIIICYLKNKFFLHKCRWKNIRSPSQSNVPVIQYIQGFVRIKK